MFKRDRGDGGALVVLGTIVFALVVVSALGLASRYIANYPSQTAQYYSHQTDNPDVAVIARAISDFNPADDTIAQWIMAAFTVVATVASVGALIYLARTLHETRRIGQAQVRAYVRTYVENTSSFDEGLSADVKIVVENTGQSPARNTKRAALVTVCEFPIVVPKEAWELSVDPESSGVVPRGSPVYIVESSDLMTAEQVIAIREKRASLCAFVVIEYESVFGTIHHERMGFVARPDDDALHKWTSNHLERDLNVQYMIIDQFTQSN